MVRLRRGKVLAVIAERPGAIEIEVDVAGETVGAVAYPPLCGPVRPGDTVILNTTAVELGLGTGGVHFVIAVESGEDRDANGEGRVMKLRYTPLQTAVRSVEEAYVDALEGSPGLGGMPVVVAPLHSMVGPVAAGARAAGAGRVAYVMTDGAALPGAFSRLVHGLRETGLLDGFVTCGQAFGGELEAATLWTGLLAAREVLGADAVVVADGPGNLGTATKWGVSALEGGHSLNAAAALGGRPVAALRMSFADARDRHVGVSHHSMTILGEICLVQAEVAVPVLEEPQRAAVWSALRDARLEDRHRLVEVEGHPALQLLGSRGVQAESMGRTPSEDPAFFLAAGAAGVLAGRMAVDGTAPPTARSGR